MTPFISRANNTRPSLPIPTVAVCAPGDCAPANARQWKPFPLIDPRSQSRKGGISIAPRDVDSVAKSDRIRKAGI